MMSFRELLRKIKGLHCKFSNGMCRVQAVYWETDRALILIDANTNYTVWDESRLVGLTYLSDGSDTITVDVSELEKFN